MDDFSDRSYTHFPIWIELSGLPEALMAKAPSASPWTVFKKLVELDIDTNRLQPGHFEVSQAELAARTGITVDKISKAIKAMRKLGVVRAFLPDSEEEMALFEIITPLPTPVTADEVRARYPDPFVDTPWPPRYAVPVEDPEKRDPEKRETKIKRVVELYLNTFSMKINSLIMDELTLIADNYDLPLVEMVFQRAKQREARTLSWILSDIRRELKVKRKAEELKKEAGSEL